MDHILELAQREGVVFRVDGDNLRAKGKMSNDLKQLIRDNKPALIAAIQGVAQAPAATSKPPLPKNLWLTWGESLAWVRGYASIFSEQYAVAYGMGRNSLYYVAAPDSGLAAPSPLPYHEPESGQDDISLYFVVPTVPTMVPTVPTGSHGHGNQNFA